MKKLILTLAFLGVFANTAFSQADCLTAAPFCTASGTTFPASTSTTAAVGPDYGCLGSQPNPAWYYLNISTSGDIIIDLSNSAVVDIDFAAWGPFATQAAMCAGTSNSPFDCSYSTSATEQVNIIGAVAGEWYMVLITNFSGMPTNISAGVGAGTTGATNCAILCNMTGLTATPGPCVLPSNTFTLTGTITYTTPPATGTLTVTNSCSGVTQVFNPPFPPTSQTYSLAGIPANGAGCTVTATFSADPTCTMTTSFTAPPPCTVTCNISAVSATPTACNVATQQYDVSGSVTYTNAPATGTLTITNSCGGTPIVLNAPFTSPSPYSFPGLSANGAGCNITAVFSADPACTFTQAYTAPAPCLVVCSITALTATPSACDPVTNNYSVTGSITFTNPPATGTLTVTSSCGGTVQVLNPPFVSSLAYALNGLTSDGLPCTVTAVFSADPLCTLTQNYTAPASCSSCPVTAANNGPLCEGQTLNLTASTVAGATYSWTGPGGFTSTLQNPTITGTTAAMSGVYTVTVNVVGPPTCTANSSTTVTITANPIVTVNSPTTCAGISTTLTAAGATTYAWSTGAVTNPITVPGTAGTYTVIGTNGTCADTAIATVTTSAPPIVNFSGDTLNGCNPVICNFVANQTGNPGATYTWNFGDGSTGVGPNITHLYTTNGCHTVTLTVSFGAGCSTTDSIPCMIDVYPQPVANFFFTPTTIDILNPTAYFTNTSTNSTIWLWDFGDTTSSVLENPSHTWQYIGVHPVTLTVSNANGCTDAITYMIIIDDIITAYIPNTFTPNNDGVNDVFNMYSNGISPENFEMLIFDRWGNKIFTSRTLSEGWNGCVNNRGEVVQEDVYVYKFNYRDFKGKKHKAIGHVTIVK